MCPIFTTGDGRQRQYARREDGLLFYRIKRVEAPGWSAWHIATDQHPTGLWLNRSAGNARLPSEVLNAKD